MHKVNEEMKSTIRVRFGPENKRCVCQGKPRLSIVLKVPCGCAELVCPKCGEGYSYYCAEHLLARI